MLVLIKIVVAFSNNLHVLIQIQALHKEGKVNDLLYALSRGPDPQARVYNGTFINGFFFRNDSVERDLNTQNSGVLVRGDA